MRTVAVVNLKGGVGKSTTAINMALIMSQAHGKNVLLIDNDFQAAVTKFFGKHSYDKPSMEDVLRNPMLSAEEVIIPSGRWGLDIIPANMNMIAAADDLITDKDSDQIGRIRNILNQVEEEYDYCIIDCHPSVGIEVLNALAAAEDIIIPIKADKNALDGITDTDANHSDDKNEAEEYYIQVDIWSEEDCFLLKRKIKKLLKKAGFTYFAGNDDYEQDTKIYHKAARFYFLINTEGED